MSFADLYSNADAVTTLLPAAVTSTATGTTVDLAGFQGSPLVVIHAGAWTDAVHTFTIEESADNSSWATATDIQGTAPVVDGAADDDQVYILGYTGSLRYIRVKSTVSGSPTSGAIYGASVIRFRPRKGPAQ